MNAIIRGGDFDGRVIEVSSVESLWYSLTIPGGRIVRDDDDTPPLITKSRRFQHNGEFEDGLPVFTEAE